MFPKLNLLPVVVKQRGINVPADVLRETAAQQALLGGIDTKEEFVARLEPIVLAWEAKYGRKKNI